MPCPLDGIGCIPLQGGTTIVEFHPKRQAWPDLLEDYVIHGMPWHGQLFKRGYRDSHDDQQMEMEMLDVHCPPAKTLDGDGMWEDDLAENEKPKCSFVADFSTLT